MIGVLPFDVEIGGKKFKITNDCDYRVCIDIIQILNDKEMSDNEKVETALFVFYENLNGCTDLKKALVEMLKIVSYDEKYSPDQKQENEKPPLMDWDKDFKLMVAPINKILGYDVRMPNKFTHWYTFMSAYMEIGECTYSTVLSIRDKRMKGQPLEKWEEKFYIENREIINLPVKLTDEQEEWLCEEEGD